MKKTYMKPSMKVVLLQHQSMLCTSPGNQTDIPIPDGQIDNEEDVW